MAFGGVIHPGSAFGLVLESSSALRNTLQIRRFMGLAMETNENEKRAHCVAHEFNSA